MSCCKVLSVNKVEVEVEDNSSDSHLAQSVCHIWRIRVSFFINCISIHRAII